MTIEEKSRKILEEIQQEQGTDVTAIFRRMVKKGYINMHGPEHHMLDGACLLVAFRNAGGKIELETALKKLFGEAIRMPGAMCGLWGICGAISSIGASLAIIDGTGPLSSDGTWGEHMAFTSKAAGELGKINGPRCCKRDAMISFKNAVDYVKEHYDIELQYNPGPCEFTSINQQCIKERCPFYRKENL